MALVLRVLTLIFSLHCLSQTQSQWPPASWTEVLPPFPIHGPVHYVGSRELSAYLLEDEAGLILVNIGMEANVPMVLSSIRSLGFDPGKIKYLLITQAHFDHGGGAALLREQTGAQVMAGPADAELMKRGGMGDYVFGDQLPFPAVAEVVPANHGETLVLGKLHLTVIATPGHTPGSTSWMLSVETPDGKKTTYLLQASISVLEDAQLVENPVYPQVQADFLSTLQKFEALEADFYLPDHLSFARPQGTDPKAIPKTEWFTDRSILTRQHARSHKNLHRMLEEQGQHQ